MATLHLTAATTVADLRKEFNEAFGSQVKVYIGNKGADMSSKLGDAGLSKFGDFECRSSLTVATFIERMKEEFGLKVKVYTCDEWVAVLDGLTLESSGKVKKNAVKADMESMIAYQRTEGEDSPTPQVDNTAKIEADKAAAEKTKAEEEAMAAAKLAADKAKAELDKQKAEAEAAKAELARIQAEAAKAKAEAEAAKAAAEKAQAEAAKAAESEQLVNKTDTKCPEGALNGLFSISENQKIRFSKGNLQFCPKRFEWRFAENQWDIIGAGNTKVPKDNEAWMDIFGYGASGYMGVSPLAVSNFPTVCLTSTKYDWGLFNSIVNGGNKSGIWRTLSAKEWSYILHKRFMAEKFNTFATVCGQCGLLLLPDDYYDHCIPINLNSVGTYETNVYDVDQWKILENNGCVFLPATGDWWRSDNVFMNPNSGSYHSTDMGQTGFSSTVMQLIFRGCSEQSFGPYCKVDSELSKFASVRLVQDVK